MSARAAGRDPWRRARVGELQDQLLPRWFVLLAIGSVLAAVVAAAAAFAVFGPRTVPVAARRPPPPASGELTNAVGRYVTGESPPVPYEQACPRLRGISVAGTPADQEILRTGLAGLCNTTLPDDVDERLRTFASAGGVVRFAQFEATGVDSTAALEGQRPVILVNARLQRTDPLFIAPAVAHDVTFLDADPATAEGALQARRVENLVCERLLEGRRRSRGCEDAAALLASPDPLGALRDAGFR